MKHLRISECASRSLLGFVMESHDFSPNNATSAADAMDLDLPYTYRAFRAQADWVFRELLRASY
jgi:hypothetical protein